MMSANFSGFWTPSPLVSTKSTQPPFVSSEIGQPPPSLPLFTDVICECPLREVGCPPQLP